MPVRSCALSADRMKVLARFVPAGWGPRFVKMNFHMKMHRIMPILLAISGLTGISTPAKAQALVDSEGFSSAVVSSSPQLLPGRIYTRPSEKTKLQNYFFDAFGPYPVAGVAIAAGINQYEGTPPEWGQGAEGYGKRFGSNFAIEGVSTTTRYALAEAFREDTLYYRCACKGFFPRLSHAALSSFVSRRGDDGHRVFSFPALVAPYAGTMAAVYGWYPGRFGAKDAFRMGNYNLLGYIGGNIALEFLYSGPHSLLSRWHMNNRHGAPAPDSNP